MSRRFVVVYEAEADFHTATELADRVLVDVIDWLEEDQIADQRQWIGTIQGHHRLTWTEIKKLAREAGIRAHGHFDGKPGEPDAAAARRAILYLKEAIPDPDAILLIRDQDDQPDRLKGLEQARGRDHGETVLVVGLAVVERESWVISGFEPQNEEETSRLEAERQKLGFNPCEKSHKLTACKNDQASRSPKRVLRNLSGADRDRESDCWASTPLDRLRERGGKNGLAAYLLEVRERLAPLIGHVANK